MLLAGIDIGTTGCKISVFDENGKYLGSIYQEYPVSRTRFEHEVDAGTIWATVQKLIEKAATAYPNIGGIGITSFGETFVLLDENDVPLYPSMLYTDPRGGEECTQLVKSLGAKFITETTGLVPHSMYSISKLMWIKKYRPELYAKAKHVFLMEDYVVYMLSGRAQIDYSLATRTMAFDIHKLAWNPDIFRAADVDMSLFSNPVPTGSSAAVVRPKLAIQLGLSGETLIVSVSHDQVAAAIGSGVFDEYSAVDGAGTVECITPVFGSYDSEKMSDGKYAVVPYVLPGKYVCYAFSYTGGALVKWFVDNLAGYAAQKAVKQGVRIYSELEDGWDNKPTGLLVLPHFAGAATPYMDTASKGAIVGLSITNTQQDIHLAIMEGVCYEMQLNMEYLAQAGVPIKQLRATGGGANSRVWMQMKADILNIPVISMQLNEAGATGSAMLVGVAAGVFSDLKEAAGIMVSEQKTYQPRPEVHRQYLAVYERYKKLYRAVRPLV